MKSYILSIGFILSTSLLFSHLQAQTSTFQKGNIWILGSSNMDVTFSDGTPLKLTAAGGYFFMENLAGGAEIAYESQGDSTRSDVTLLARYFFSKGFFAGAGIQFANDESSLRIEGGYEWFISDLVALEPRLIFPLGENQRPSFQLGLSIFFDK